MPADTIPHRLLEQGRKRPSAAAYHIRDATGVWQTTSWGTFVGQVRQAAKALIALGLTPGDRVCVVGNNRPEWVIVDHATMLAGGVPAGIYTTCSPPEVAYIVQHAEAALVLVEDAGQAAKLHAEQASLPTLKHIVGMQGAGLEGPLTMSWEDFLGHGDQTDDAAVDARLQALDPGEMATFIYTSGTTGPPKAVMLSHHNLSWTASVAARMLGVVPDDRMVSYLPLSHIAEQIFTVHGPATVGYEIWYATSIDTLLTDLQDAKPTIVFGVPRVWEKMHARLTAAFSEATGVKAALLGWATGVGRRTIAAANEGRTPGPLLALQHRLAKKLVLDKVRARLGLEEARCGISGAAPIAAEVLEFFSGLDLPILEVYGQSEDTGPTTFNMPGRTRFGTVGPPVEGVEVRIAEDGEICVRGPNVFLGYFKDQAATDDAMVDGWLMSGDLGAFDDDGFLTITGRKKEIIITAGGKNIAPKNIEAALKNLPLVSQAVVIGDRRKFLSALITLDPDAVSTLPGAQEPYHVNEAVRAALQSGIDDEVNPLFARVEHIRKFAVLPRDLTVDDGELTPTLKVKRRVVDEHFSDVIEGIYADA